MKLEKHLQKFNCNLGISTTRLSTITLPSSIPEEYLNFLKTCNGGEGFIGEEYVILFKAEDILQINVDYAVSDLVPGIILFGSNGASEALAFDIRSGKVKYILIPFLFEYDAIIELADNFEDFIVRIAEQGFFI